MGAVIAVVILLVLAWFFLVLPARRRQRAHRAMQDEVAPGDEIITAGGIHGVVREAAPDRLRVEIAPATVVTLDRRAVAAVARDLPGEEDPPGGELT
jgi:preprotein translocase subunit YajC